jgi:hypothetical protein
VHEKSELRYKRNDAEEDQDTAQTLSLVDTSSGGKRVTDILIQFGSVEAAVWGCIFDGSARGSGFASLQSYLGAKRCI